MPDAWKMMPYVVVPASFEPAVLCAGQRRESLLSLCLKNVFIE